MKRYDILIIGSGLAGMSLALRLAETKKVALVTKTELLDAASAWAQGGIAAVLGDDDSPENHIRDTHVAGAGLCKDEAVRMVVENGRRAVEWLVEQGVPFTREDATGTRAELHLTREGGHSHRRIAHAADATGRAVQKTLAGQLKSHPNIEVIEHHIAVDLIMSHKIDIEPAAGDINRCYGAYVLDNRDGKVSTLGAQFTVLATGGAGKVYLYTSNPDVATGDGVAMGWRAGCRVANMEFIQFHPTCLYHPAAKSYLITEAVRGEGGHLKIPATGERFMLTHDERAELAPRDIVARAIDFEMKKRGIEFVHLDITHKPADFIKEHFPNIYEKCLSLGIDITTDPIPVVPAAHYTCGGLVVDLRGRTEVDALYAIGEVTCTGLHGANRLASNSLLECLVFSEAVEKDLRNAPVRDIPPLPDWDESRVTNADEEVIISHNWDELRRFMWDYVGIVRTDKRLARALHRIDLLKAEVHEYYANFRVSNDLIELRNLLQTAELIVRCAISRKESRGLHYSLDYPDTAVLAKDTVLTP